MDSFERPIFADVAVPAVSHVNVADFLFSSPWGDCDISFNWTDTGFNAPHIHNHWELFVIAEGSVTHCLNGKDYRLNKGDAYVIRPCDLHSFKYPSENYQQINFLIKTEFLEKYFNLYSVGLYEALLTDSLPLKFKISENALQTVIYKTLSIQTVADSDLKQNIIHAKIIFGFLIQHFFEQKFPYTDSYPLWLKNLLAELNKPKAYLLGSEEVARLSPFSYSRLTVLFKKYMKRTINEYMLEMKLRHAQELLRFTNLTTLEISGEIGFSSLSHFNHIFKKTFGATPSGFRAQSKNEK